MQSILQGVAATALLAMLATGAAWAQDAAPAEPAPADAADPAAPAGDAAPAGGEAPAEGQAPAPADAGAAPAEGAAEGAPDPNAGDPAAPEILEIVRGTFGDWEVRCAPDGEDCFMYQLALDDQQNPVAEVSLLRLPAGEQAVAGITVVTPLGTLLPPGLGLQIDTNEARQYPFAWCSQVGCFSRFGLDEASVNTMKRGRAGRMTLLSVGAPDQPVVLDLSLMGFTAAYDSLAVPTRE
jgi:invasion protein IalB